MKRYNLILYALAYITAVIISSILLSELLIWAVWS